MAGPRGEIGDGDECSGSRWLNFPTAPAFNRQGLRVADSGTFPAGQAVAHGLGVRLHDLRVSPRADQQQRGFASAPMLNLAVLPAAEQMPGGVLKQVNA